MDPIRAQVEHLEKLGPQFASIFQQIDAIRDRISEESRNQFAQLWFMSKVIDGQVISVKTSLLAAAQITQFIPENISLEMAYGRLEIALGYTGLAEFGDRTIVNSLHPILSMLESLPKSRSNAMHIALQLEAAQGSISHPVSDFILLAAANTRLARSLL